MAAGFKTAQVNASDVPSTQTDFPSYVDLSRLGITTLAEAQSVRVYADSGKTTEWAREIVSATEMHVKVPSMTSTVEMYVDWDGVRADYAVGDTYGRNAVWSGVYNNVWHMESNGNDSTSAGKTMSAINAPTIGAEKIGNGFDNGTATNKGYRRTGDLMGFSSSTDDFRKSMWFMMNTHPTGTGVFFLFNRMYGEAAGTQIRCNYQNNNGSPRLAFQNDAGTAPLNHNITLSVSTWYKISFVKEGTTLKIYLDGVLLGTTGTASGSTNYSIYPDEMSILTDRTSYSGGCSPGAADEITLKVGGTVSADWETTEYNNQNDEATFWGTWTDVVASTGFKQATVNAADVPSTQTDFPSYVDLSRVGITTLAEAQGIRVYSDVAKTTELAREIVSVTEMHVKIPSLTSTTTIYIDWDDTRADYAVGDTYGRNAVWTGYETVYHLDSLTIDSTGNGYTLTNNNSTVNGTGQIGDGADTIAASSKYLNNSTSLTPAGTSAVSFSTWIKNNAEITSGFYTLASIDDTTNNVGFWWLYQFVSGTNNLIVTRNRYGSTQTDVSHSINLGTTARKLEITYDGTTVRSYVDGVEVNTGSSSGNGTANPTANGIAIGRVNRFGAGFNTNTVMDEVRVATTTNSANWITTEYNNQSDEATFWGTWTDAAAGGDNTTNFFYMM